MKKSLYELSLEYDEAIRQQQELTDRVRIALNEAKRRRDTDEAQRLMRRLEVYYEEIRDMKMIAQTLKNYYAPSAKEVRIAV